MILFINACVRADSRTKALVGRLLSRTEEPIEELRLDQVQFPTVDEAFLQRRDRLIAERRFDDPLFRYARRFAAADTVVIAAPYWDLSFPASLKQYIEQINVVGVTFRYTPAGVPEGLCRAKRLYYVMTAGGTYVPEMYGFGYVEALARGFYGIDDVQLIKAVGLDIDGADVDAVIRECEEHMPII